MYGQEYKPYASKGWGRCQGLILTGDSSPPIGAQLPSSGFFLGVPCLARSCPMAQFVAPPVAACGLMRITSVFSGLSLDCVLQHSGEHLVSVAASWEFIGVVRTKKDSLGGRFERPCLPNTTRILPRPAISSRSLPG